MEPSVDAAPFQTPAYNEPLARRKAYQPPFLYSSSSLTLTPANNNASELKKYKT